MNCLKLLTIESYALIFLGIAISLQRLSMGAGNVLYVLSILCFLISLFKQYKTQSLKNKISILYALPYFKAISIACLLIIPSVIASSHSINAFKTMLEIWIYRSLPLFIIPICATTRKSLYWLFTAVFISLNLDSLVALYQYAILHLPRPSGFSNNPLNLAAILSMTIPVQIIVAVEKVFPIYLRKLSSTSILINILGLIGGQSRGSWLLLAFTPFFSIKYWKQNKFFIIACLVIASIIGGYITSSPSMQARIISTTNMTTDRSNADRIVVWESAIAMIKDRPLLGVGPGQFYPIYKEHYKLPEVTQHMIHTHNNLIQVTVDSGILGFIAFTFLFGYIEIKNMIQTLKGNPYAYIRLAATTFFLLFGIIDYTFDASAIMKLYWYYIALSLSLEAFNSIKHK